jgi:hypothetical protein
MGNENNQFTKEEIVKHVHKVHFNEADDPTDVIWEHGILDKQKCKKRVMNVLIIVGFCCYFYLLIWASQTNLQVTYMLNPPRTDCPIYME